MWIFLGILGFIAVIITVILLLPVYIIIKNDENGNPIIRYKFLFKTYGENPDPNNPLLKAVKKLAGIDNLSKKQLQHDIARRGVRNTLSQTFDILIDLLHEILGLLKYCTATKLKLEVVCASEDAADAAIGYGQCCAIAYPLIGLVESALKKTCRRGRKINIRCDFNEKEDYANYNFTVYIRIYHLIAALFRVSVAEAKRQIEKQKHNPPKSSKAPKA